jgi:hypothetical protein
MLISELEKKTGLTRHTIRFYEVERIRQKMRDIERKKAELDRIQSYLAQILASKLTLQHATENGPACCESGTVSEVDKLPLPERNGSQPRLKGR